MKFAELKLYLNLYSERNHRKLAKYLLDQKKLKWLLTYDSVSLTKKIYLTCQRWQFDLGYSLQAKQKGKELLIAPNALKLPDKRMFVSNKWSMVRKLRREKECKIQEPAAFAA